MRSRFIPRLMPLAPMLLLAVDLAIFWPGYATYDSVTQYRQAITGVYDDWHPPAMARLWSVFGAHGTAPMFAIQVAGYWLGFGLLATALARLERNRAAALVIGIALWPPLLGWQAAVLKDTQMLGAMLAATGIVGWWRLRNLRVPWAAGAMAGLLLAYAVMVRANAVFAVVPLAIGLARRPADFRAKVAVAGLVTIAVLTLAPPINHGPLAAAHSGVERTQALYDLSAIAVRTGDTAATGISPAAIAVLRARHCVKPFFWDPLGDASHCEAAIADAHHTAPGVLYKRLAGAIMTHPVAYAQHRLAHWNSTERWIVPRSWPGATPPLASEPNELGLTAPGGLARDWQRSAAVLVETPAGWPILGVIVAIGVLLAARDCEKGAARDLALTLLTSALALEASFLILSIASDLRYHLWPMAATALAVTVLGMECRPHGRVGVGWWVACAVILLAGVAARMLLPLPAQSYAGMLA